MKKDVLVSIIVPIYNNEKYLDKCISSIVEQTYKNIEIILINNGSKDKCSEIIKKYIKKDSRIKFINIIENVGVCIARNKGIEISQGDYVCFVDADDSLSEDYVKILLENIIKEKADVVECNFKTFFEIKRESSVSNIGKYNKNDRYTICKDFLEAINFKDVPWNKIYTKKILKKAKFTPEIKESEDHEFLSRVYLNCNKKVNIEDVLYYYYFNNSNVTSQPFSKRKLHAIYARELVYESYLKAGYEDLANYEAARIILFIFNFYNDANSIENPDKKEIKKELRMKFRKYYKIALKVKTRTGGIPFSKKRKFIRYIQYYLFLVFPNFVAKIFNKLKTGVR